LLYRLNGVELHWFVSESSYTPFTRGYKHEANMKQTYSRYGGRCKQRAIIFYGGRVIANFAPKFVAMATGVARREI